MIDNSVCKYLRKFILNQKPFITLIATTNRVLPKKYRSLGLIKSKKHKAE